MKLYFASFGLVAGATVQPLPEEACYFIGLQFAHTVSRPEGDACVGIRQEADGTVVRSPAEPWLEVTAAQALMTDFLAKRKSEFPLPEPIEESLAMVNAVALSDAVVKAVKAVASGIRLDVDTEMYSVRNASRALWTVVAADWTQWKAAVLAEVDTPDLIADQLYPLMRLADQALKQPVWSSQQQKLIGACVHYLIDICSVIDPRSCQELPLASLRHLLVGTVPLYRERDPKETDESLSAANWSEWQRGMMDDNPAVSPPIADVILAVAGVSNTVRHPARNAVESAVCGNPVAFMESAADSLAPKDLLFVKLGVSVMRVCSRAWRSVGLASLRVMLSNHLSGTPLRLPTDAVDAERFLVGREWMDVRRGLLGLGSRTHKRTIAWDLLSSIVAQTGLLVPIEEDEMRFQLRSENNTVSDAVLVAAGRAMGLAIRYGRRVDELRLSPKLVALLHPRVRAQTTQAEIEAAGVGLGVPAALAGEFVASLVTVAKGMDEGMGPGGFTLFSDENWTELFWTLD